MEKVKKVDGKGKVLIPKAMLEILGVKPREEIKIVLKGKTIKITKK